MVLGSYGSYNNFFKFLLDKFIAGLVVIGLSPVIVILLLFFFITNDGKPFFFQWRVGENEKLFRMVKFKTMSDAKDKNGNLLSDDIRLTLIGRIARKTSLDEIPQLWNVLKGEMSLVGPRPLLPEYLPLYTTHQRHRHDARPGITGWAQVNGRNAISWEQKFEYDVWYIDNMSFMLDVKILFMTIKIVFKREGISQDGQATTEPFKGTHK